MILLFVVVLLTLLAVLGSAFLISSRLAAGQVPPSSRGGDETVQERPPTRFFESNLSAASDAAKLALALDLFSREGVADPAETGTNSAARNIGGSVLLWRAPEGQTSSGLGGFPAGQAFDPMAAYQDGNPATTGRTQTQTPIFFPYFGIDALGGTDPHLAATKPRRDDQGTADPTDDIVEWPWISAPFVGIPGFRADAIFVDPFRIAAGEANLITDDGRSFDFTVQGNDPLRRNLTPGIYVNDATGASFPTDADDGLVRYTASSPPLGVFAASTVEFWNDRNRQFLGLFDDADANGQQDPGETPIFAADADGDGVADSGLVPIVPGPGDANFATAIAASVGDVDRYRHEDGFYYFYAVRIVDNSALPHIDTALERTGDLPFAGGLIDVADLYDDLDKAGAADLYPNYGIFPGNIGLLDLFDNNQGTTRINQNGAGGEGDFNALLINRAGALVNRTGFIDEPGDGVDPIFNVEIPQETPERGDVQFATLGEAYGIGLAQRLYGGTTIGIQSAASGERFRAIGMTTPARGDFHHNGGGWLVPRQPTNRSALESLMPTSMLVASGNFVPQIDYIWDDFPLGAAADDLEASGAARRSYWYDAFHGMEPNGTVFGADATAIDYDAELITGTGSITFNETFPRAIRTAVNASGLVSTAYRPHTLVAGAGPSDFMTGGTEAANQQLPFGMPLYTPAADTTGGTGGITAYGNLQDIAPVRASLNTAAFGELWRAYWNVMFDDTGATPGASNAFRSVVDSGRGVGAGVLTRDSMVRLRGALAAVNTMDIRDVEVVTDRGATDVTMASVALTDATGGPNDLEARVFGTEAQPFIGEVVLQAGATTADAAVYLGVELVNPYPFEINMRGWKLVAVDDSGPELAFETIVDLPAVMPANGGGFGILVLEDGSPVNGLAVSGTGGTTFDLTVLVAGGKLREIMLMRPVQSSGTIPGAALAPELTAALSTADSAAWQLMVPVDAVDLAGASSDAADDPDNNRIYHYDRVEGSTPRGWDYAYHGELENNTHFAIDTNPANVSPDLGVVDAAGTGATMDEDRVIVVGPALSGPGARVTTNSRSFYPYGGFARDGDVVNVPYIGSYHIVDTAGTGTGIVASNPVTVDAVIADEANAEDDTTLGRFVGQAADGSVITDKGWASDVFDYVTTLHAPGSDLFPMVDYRLLDGDPTLKSVDVSTVLTAAGLSATTVDAVFELTSDLLLSDPTPIGADPYANYDDGLLGLPGRINLHTAPVGILNLLPLDLDGTGIISEVDTHFDAQEIVAADLSDGTGVGERVESIVDLLGPLGLAETAGPAGSVDLSGRSNGENPTALDSGAGDFFDYDGSLGLLGVPFEQVDLELADAIRLSNIATQRSDSYTVYVLLQAWEDVDSAQPRLARQQRVAFTVDRSGVRPYRLDAAGDPQPWSTVIATPDEVRDAMLNQLQTTVIPVQQ